MIKQMTVINNVMDYNTLTYNMYLLKISTMIVNRIHSLKIFVGFITTVIHTVFYLNVIIW